MSAKILKIRVTVKCKKEHICSWCSHPVPVGSSCVYFAGMLQGVFFHSYDHVDCFTQRGMEIHDPATKLKLENLVNAKPS